MRDTSVHLDEFELGQVDVVRSPCRPATIQQNHRMGQPSLPSPHRNQFPSVLPAAALRPQAKRNEMLYSVRLISAGLHPRLNYVAAARLECGLVV